MGAAQTNFDRALPSPQSDLARDILKDPYTFDLLGITDASNERAIEKALLLRLRDFLIELGVGFAFVGSQYRLEAVSYTHLDVYKRQLVEVLAADVRW